MRRLTLLVVLALAVLGAPVSVAAAAPGFSTAHQVIAGDGGTPLSAFVIQPTGRGNGPFPLLVLPSSWAVNNLEYVGAAWKLAYESGYVVVSYTSRGFLESGGEIETAGDRDISDARKIIDWALANTNADPSKIGMGGISYGAGISLLTAAADSRVRAVAAMSTWTDLAESVYPNDTINKQAVQILLGLGGVTGRPGTDLRQVATDYATGQFANVTSLTPQRSAVTKLAQLNANKPAIMIGNAWNDSFFEPGQVVDFYGGLTGPKRLMLSPGDHATAELFGAAGLPNEIWTSVGRWFDRYLRGVDNGIDRETPVNLKSTNGGGWRGYQDWTAAGQKTDTISLSDKRISAGRDTIANSGTAFVSGILQQFVGVPTPVATALIDRSAAAVWNGPVSTTAKVVNGIPRLHATVTPTASGTSLFGYLYDVDQLGLGALITHKAITLRQAGPQVVDLALQPISWDVQPGHRLVLAVDTMDPRYASTSRIGSSVTFGGQAQLTVPLG